MRADQHHGIAVAANEASKARHRSQRIRERRYVLQSRVRSIDHLLEVLEARNMDGIRDIDRAVRAELDGLSRAVGVPVPCDVRLARTTRRLHAALLDWQQQVLDTLVPARAHYVDVDAIFDADDALRAAHH